MSADDDKRITVETETVQTPAQNLLPVQLEDKQDEEDTGIKTQEEPSAKLIDHNPMSLHNSSGAIRNKKSNLFMDSFLGKEASPSIAAGITHKPLVAGSSAASKSYRESTEESALPSRAAVVEEPEADEKNGGSAGLTAAAAAAAAAGVEHGSEEPGRKTREPPKKSDFFAAQLASAVGENEISDSEETFVYESTATSNKNVMPGEPRSHGLPTKMSAPLLNHTGPRAANAKLLNRAKATRHTSIAAIPAPVSEQSDDLHSLKYVNHVNQQEIRPVRSYTAMPQSPGKRLSLISLGQNGGSSVPRRTSRKTSNNLNSNNARRKVSHRRQLRTTASKIFDAHGASLRRYSGVPDDVNLEDYIEQTGGELTPNKFAYHSDSDFEDEPVSYARHGDDEEDNHSMFYYSHPKTDLEARPCLSDYDEEEGEDHDRVGHQLEYPPGIEYYGDSYFYQPTEATPLKKKSTHHTGYSPHNFYTTKTTWTKMRNIVYFAFVVSFLLTLGFISGFLLATNKELHDLEIAKVTSVLVSTDELVFDVIATAFNPGFFTVEIQKVELDIFAKTSHLGTEGDPLGTPYQTILLGTAENMETSLQFQGGFFHRNYDISRSSVKLVKPGLVENHEGQEPGDSIDGVKIENGHDKWRQLIRYDFDLIIRGNMYYKMPFFNSEKSVGVQGSTSVNPDDDGTRVISFESEL
ncbi:LAME_0D05578g1_1 [Lachancea meyersii CBS 8951]|uniref:LAME_0D05578g1_1 n=1 Tax=Lachancea meyersii CBS 8951 TaxID=1266667 RepID=A0A1G4J9C2_9SACH|nr:LAME_0D05578g1_1 [Lachancea meyersii CBS 8951]